MSDERALATQPTNYDRIRAIARSDKTMSRFAEILGASAPGFVSSVLIAVADNPKLMECTPGSIIGSAMRAATLSLSVDPGLGQAYLIPYKDHGTPKARFQIGYKGLIQIAIRTGKYRFINVAPVYDGQIVEEDQLRGIHYIKGHHKGEKKAIGFMLYFELVNGFSKTHYMTVPEILEHAEKFSMGFDRSDSFWKKHTTDMCKKTVLRQGLTKWGYFNPHDVIAMAESAASDEVEDEIIDIDFSETEPSEPVDEAKVMNELGFDQPSQKPPDASSATPPKMTYETAAGVMNSDKPPKPYGEIDSDTLVHMSGSLNKSLKANGLTPEAKAELQYKLDAILVILQHRSK